MTARGARAPGVYVREVEEHPPTALDLSVAGFVGQAERGPVNRPQRLTSWGQYREIFGGFIGHGYLPYLVYGFFSNGGRRCYVVRVVHETVTTARVALEDASGGAVIEVRAANPGRWGEAVEVTCEERGSRELVLTELAEALAAGASEAAVGSVAALGPGDDLVLVDPARPFRRQEAVVQAVDATARKVTFRAPVATALAAGSRVLGRGFRLTFRDRSAAGREEVFDDLTLDPDHERYFSRIVNGEPVEGDHVARIALGLSLLARVLPLAPGTGGRPRGVRSLKLLRSGGGDDRIRGDGAHRYFTGYDAGAHFALSVDPESAGEGEAGPRLLGLAALETVSEVGTVAIPDLIVPDLWKATPPEQVPEEGIVFAEPPAGIRDPVNLREGSRELLRHATTMGDRMALLDPPAAGADEAAVAELVTWARQLSLLSESRNGALYYPRLRHRAGDFDGRTLWLPPSGHVAGVIARVEGERGVGKAPANEVLEGVVDLEVCVTDAEQAELNPAGVNCLRLLPGRGLRVWGARTLSRDPQWRYVNVRRVALAIVKQILTRLQWTVFEPNDRRLWAAIRASLTLHLQRLFEGGALAGASAEEAFYVKCDAETNPPEVVDRGQTIVEVGFAPAEPAEFIVVTIKRTAESLTAVERTA